MTHVTCAASHSVLYRDFLPSTFPTPVITAFYRNNTNMECQDYVDMLHRWLDHCKNTLAHLPLASDDVTDRIFLENGSYAAFIAYRAAKQTALSRRSRPGKPVPEFKHMMNSLTMDPIAMKKEVAAQLAVKIEPADEKWWLELQHKASKRRKLCIVFDPVNLQDIKANLESCLQMHPSWQ